jgi:hypothetical protein
MVTRGGIISGGLIAEALDIWRILAASVQFASVGQKKYAWPSFLQFPGDQLIHGRKGLVVDDIWSRGRTISTVAGRVRPGGGSVETAALHYQPGASLFCESGPDHYAAVTDRFVIYPWETQHRQDTEERAALAENWPAGRHGLEILRALASCDYFGPL